MRTMASIMPGRLMTSTPRASIAGDAHRPAQHVGVVRRGGHQRPTEVPRRIRRDVLVAGDLGLDLRPPVAVERQRVGDERLDALALDRRQRRASSTASPVPASRRTSRRQTACMKAMRRATADRRVGARGRVADGDDAGRRGGRIEAPYTVLDLGHHVDARDRLGVDPVGDERIAADDALPHVDVARPPERRILGARRDDDRPMAVVGGQREERHRLVVLEWRSEHRGHRPVGRAVVPAVVHVPAVRPLLRRRRRTGGGEPVPQHRAPPAGVDHEVGA